MANEKKTDKKADKAGKADELLSRGQPPLTPHNQAEGLGDKSFDINPVAIEDEMRHSYLDYAMSVIVSRALPDVRDGLKPVHRRILYSMYENGYEHNKPHRKSARVVGDVIGKYHPHGDQSIYDALVRMAQSFSMRLPLLDGQGNFGSIDGDPPAAMRYTEVRMAKAATSILQDIDKDTIDFQPNYDESEKEPTVLPSRIPNLLANGAGGIAVGMATNIPPYNLGELLEACKCLLEKPDATDEEIYEIVPAPDFPTGAQILGRKGAHAACLTGRGSIIMRARASIETIRKDREAIIITEIPYQVNKTTLIEKFAELVRDKVIEGISDIRDESDRDGMRIVVELRRDAMGDIVLNQLYRFSALQTSFSANMLALDAGKPRLMNLKTMLNCFLTFRKEVITRRTKCELNKARDRAHILVGLALAVANIDEVIQIIRTAPSPKNALSSLLKKSFNPKDISALIKIIDDPRHKVAKDGTYKLSQTQAKAILELRLQRLTALGREEIGDELKSLHKTIAEYLEILASQEKIKSIIASELEEVGEGFITPRRTEIIDEEFADDDEDLVPPEAAVVTVSNAGYIKRVPLSTYRAQRRGGKGRAGMTTKEEDFVTNIFAANTRQSLLFFSSAGMVYRMKVWKLPAGSPQSKGKALVNLLPLKQGERIATILPLPLEPQAQQDIYVMFATSKGSVKRNKLSDFERINRNGKIAIKLDKGNLIIDIALCTDNEDVLLTAASGRAIRFSVKNIRVLRSRASIGVRGIRLKADDEVISMAILRHSSVSHEERMAYLKQASSLRRLKNANGENGESGENGMREMKAIMAKAMMGEDFDDEEMKEIKGKNKAKQKLTQAQYQKMADAEEFILTISEKGFGKRSSSYHYRTSARGGQGIPSMIVNKRNGKLVGSFPIKESDEIMLVTDGGTLIRCPVRGISIQGRNTQGVTIFKTKQEAKVVSVVRLGEAKSADTNGLPPQELGSDAPDKPKQETSTTDPKAQQ